MVFTGLTLVHHPNSYQTKLNFSYHAVISYPTGVETSYYRYIILYIYPRYSEHTLVKKIKINTFASAEMGIFAYLT